MFAVFSLSLVLIFLYLLRRKEQVFLQAGHRCIFSFLRIWVAGKSLDSLIYTIHVDGGIPTTELLCSLGRGAVPGNRTQ